MHTRFLEKFPLTMLPFMATLISLSIFTSHAIGEEIKSASLNDFKERHNPEVNVSGHIVVGLMAKNAYQGLQQNKLIISTIYGNIQSDVCLKVISQDGAYLVDGAYAIENLPVGKIQLPYPTTQKKIISEFTDSNVAITVTDGVCSLTADRYLLPGLADNLPKTARVFINGFDATDVYFMAQSGDKAPAEGDCSYITEGRHTAYNFVCDIPLKSHTAKSSISIFREVYGRELPEVKLTLFN